ncbi:MAG: helix-turn-helix transcriptional regulator [Ruminococcaceae bacterium]|nr:helix-turn-helix transcriptional regulator [Oscillospiraceae bacterium]
MQKTSIGRALEPMSNTTYTVEVDEIVQALIEARHASGMTQKELSKITGIAQGDISKLEKGNANPSLRTLIRLAEGMGMQLKVEFGPESH